MNKIEEAISNALIHWVHDTYPDTIITTTANEKSYRQSKHIGSVGITDILIFDTRSDVMYVLFLELKKKNGKLLPSQITWNSVFDAKHVASNNMRAVAYGFDEAKRIIAEWLHSPIRA